MKLPEEYVKSIALKMTFDGDKVSAKSMDETKDGTFKVDPTKKPKEIDITVGGKASKGIYELKDDTLKICVSDGDRPTEFVTKAGTKAGLITFKKDK
jgi:uncharacterized protein (TIGR03067 family)